MKGRSLTMAWPGRARLWLRGGWTDLGLAVAFAAVLNFALVTTFIWPQLLSRDLPAWEAAITAATATIHLEMYIIHRDPVGRRFIELLADRARAGIKVRVIYDWFGCGWSPLLGLFNPLIAAGVFYGLLSVDPLWAKVAVVGASLPLGATAFVLAQRYKLLEVETSCSAVLSTALSVFTVSIVMSALG
jgi:hypothetical protein